MTPSTPLKAVTREIVDAIHKKTTVLTSVIYIVTIVFRVSKNLFISLQKLTKKEKRVIKEAR